MSINKTFSGIARFDQNGELACFCYAEDLKEKRCSCVGEFQCYSADFTITLKESIGKKSKEENKTIKITKDLEESTRKIKAGLLNLEKAMRKNKFRF